MSDEVKRTPKCFVLMPISDPPGYDVGHFARVYEHVLKPAIVEAGFLPFRADDSVKTDYIVVGVIQQIVDSDMVVCDLSSRNPNVMYELGVRQAFNKPAALVKDIKTDRCFDIQGLRCVDYDGSLRIDTVQKDIERIAASVKETAAAGPEDMNSIVKLAGIKTADTPQPRTISPDTALILSSIATLEKRLDAQDANCFSPSQSLIFEKARSI